jgi:GTP cyclohydrolase I
MNKLARINGGYFRPESETKRARGVPRPSREQAEQAEQAVSTLIRWSGDDPEREGLVATPARVVRAYEEWFSGYDQNPDELLQRTFEEVAGYDEMVLMRDIHFVSHCEHHMAPITGRVHIGYLPRNQVVGISKLARLVQVYANRLQIQERLTAEIANALDRVLGPHGVAVVIEGTHGCMTSRGVRQSQATMVTSRMLGVFRDRPETRQEFLSAINLRVTIETERLSG